MGEGDGEVRWGSIGYGSSNRTLVVAVLQMNVANVGVGCVWGTGVGCGAGG